MIDDYKYGCFRADGKEFLGDLKIVNNKAKYWQDLEDRKLRFTHIKELLNENPDVFVIGTGAGGLLEVGNEISDALQNWAISKTSAANRKIYHIKKNTEAIKIINQSIASGKKVCAVLAGGC